MGFKGTSMRYDNKTHETGMGFKGESMGFLRGGSIGGIWLRETEGMRSAQVRPVGAIGEDPLKRDTSIPRARVSFCSILKEGTKIGEGG